jgi:hypothetical protein
LRRGVFSSDAMYLIFTFGINHPHFLRFASHWFGAQKSVLQFVLKVLAQLRNSVKLKVALGNFLWGMTANPWNVEPKTTEVRDQIVLNLVGVCLLVGWAPATLHCTDFRRPAGRMIPNPTFRDTEFAGDLARIQ